MTGVGEVVNLLVEGETDEWVVRRVLDSVGLQCGRVYGQKGKDYLLRSLPRYNQAARFTPWLVVVDLEDSAACAPPFVRTHLPFPAPRMCFRVAVRAIEAWLLADRERILFSCDGFGGYGALRGAIFDDQYSDLAFYERESLRYYANIVAKFSRMVLRAIEKLAAMPVAMVAPSHGLIWRKDCGRIIELYRRWAGYATAPAGPGVTLLYASMYGNTEKMMDAVAEGISGLGLPLEIFDVARTHVSYLLPSLWTKAGVMVGAPTYEAALFPPMVYALDMAGRKGIRNKRVARFGSYGWSGGAQREFDRIVGELGWEAAGAFEFVGAPSDEELRQGYEFGATFARALRG